MATIVCRRHHNQGRQSCLESHMIEPRALRLTLSSSRPHPPHRLSSWQVSHFPFVRVLRRVAGVSPSSLRRLELCTENLGSETGSDDVLEDDYDVFSSSSSSNRQSENRSTLKQHESRRVLGDKKAIGGDFPPPLTTITGSESIRVRPLRENGRLVIKAEKAPFNNSVFRAERSDGRLRLSIFKDSTSCIDYKEETTTHTENENDNNKDGEEGFENDRNAIAVEREEEMGTTKFKRREVRGGCGGTCNKEGEHEEQNVVKLWFSGWLHP
ncbi:hypothetical protein F3Y22_tig00013960pilonHSYRG00366 [Hibiscus syriacus]|uniref:FAF domain-containing protein n=1 Tax=Hibiscus syriacus TaxID=106335 RepID=A0A6A3C3I2_HIBSY|nr:hypothetical protein F3Y22_tig00013960pilonHSYRG00366 [Hibiscus syriacus]